MTSQVLERFKLLVWKNLQKQLYRRTQFALSIFSPMLFISLLVVLRFSCVLYNYEDVKEFKAIEFKLWWENLLDIVDTRRINMQRQKSDFTDNVFIPQLKFGYAPNSSICYLNIVNNAMKNMHDLPVIGFANASDMMFVQKEENFVASVWFHETPETRFINSFDGIQYPNILNFSVVLPSEFRIYKDSYVGAFWSPDSFFRVKGRAHEETDGGTPGYIREGVATIQYFISRAYIIGVTGNDKLPPVFMKRFKVLETVFEFIGEGWELALSLCIIVGYMYPVTMFTELVARERDTKQHYLLKTNRISNHFILVTWFFNGFLTFYGSALLVFLVFEIPWNGGRATIENFPWVLSLLFFVTYLAAAVAFCLLMSKLCPTATAVVAIVPLVWVLPILPFLSRQYIETSMPILSTIITFLSLNCALCDGIHQIVYFENLIRKLPLRLYLFGRTSIYRKSFLYVVGVFCFQTCFYLLITMLIGGDYKVCKRFTCRLYRLLGKNRQENLDLVRMCTSEVFIETVTGSEERIAIEVSGVWKKFKKEYVIKNLNLKLYKNEITCLLGHSSAGKSILMNMLCGILEPTHGTIKIEGYNIAESPLEAYKNVGFSLQGVESFDEFNVVDTLWFFSRLRGLDNALAAEDVKSLIKSMELESLAELPVSHLTPGQKQVVEMVCAFAGRTQIVLLERPIAGVDQKYAQLFYNFLEKEKQHRCIVMSSFLTSVGEMVSDRLGILSGGELVSYGTQKYLSTIYKDGYRLICQLGQGSQIVVITETFEKYVPGIELEITISSNCIFLINYESKEGLIELLKHLPAECQELHIDSFKIIESTFQFMLSNACNQSTRFASVREASQYNPDTSKRSTARMTTHEVLLEAARDLHRTDSIKLTILSKQRMQGVWLFWGHVWTVLQKRFLLDVRYPLLPLVQILLPTFLAFVVLIVPNPPIDRFYQLPRRYFSMDNYDNSEVICEIRSKSTIMQKVMNAYVDMSKYKKSSNKFVKIRPGKPLANNAFDILQDEYIFDDIKTVAAATFYDTHIIAWFNNYIMHGVPLSLSMVMDALATGFIGNGSRIIFSIEFLTFATTQYYIGSSEMLKMDQIFILTMCFGFSFVWSFPLLHLTMRNVKRYSKVEFIAGMQFERLVFATMLYEFAKIVISLLPLNTVVILFYFNTLMNLDVFFNFVSIVLFTAICVLSINFLIFEFITEARGGYVLMLTFNMFSLMLFINLFMMDEFQAPTKIKSYTLLDFMPYIALPHMLLRIFADSNTISTCADLQTYETSYFLERCTVTPNCCEVGKLNVTAIFLQLLLRSVILWILYFFLKYYKSYKATKIRMSTPHDSHAESRYDQFVRHFTDLDALDRSCIDETRRVRTLQRNRLFLKPLHVENVSVRARNKTLLTGINFMIERFQTFVLLGDNGSGKSTLLSAIIEETPHTTGHINIDYSENAYSKTKLHTRIGFCPQHDTFMEGLTIIETMEFILSIRGLNIASVQKTAVSICQSLDIYRYRHHTITTCSTGVVKRASLAIAMIGFPSLIILDNPFQTLDMSGKSSLFNIISKMNKRGQSVLISSADPNDCALAHRVAILKHKRICAVGEVGKLLSEYRTEYIVVSVKLNTDVLNIPTTETFIPKKYFERDLIAQKSHRIANFIDQVFPQSIIRQIVFDHANFWVAKEMYTYDKIFRKLTERTDVIYSFSISQPTLETLYTEIAKRPNQELELDSYDDLI